MIADRNAGDTSPITWVGSFPVYASTVLAAVHTVTMVLTALAMFAGAKGLLDALEFSSLAVTGHFAIWQLVTYAFVNPPEILFLLQIYLLVAFGREIESFLGRRAFLTVYAALLLLPPAVLTLAGLAGFPSGYAGSSALHFSVFIAFATLYPRAEIFFSIQARWLAAGLLAISVLQALAYAPFPGLVVLLLDAGAAFVLVQFLRGAWTLEDMIPRRPHPHLRIVREPEVAAAPEAPAEDATIDAILEKISRSGILSLTSAERSQLEKARANLLAKDRTT
jgi:membrane associated rhomboid family serine protease